MRFQKCVQDLVGFRDWSGLARLGKHLQAFATIGKDGFVMVQDFILILGNIQPNQVLMQSLPNLQSGLPKKKVFELLRNFNERTVRYELNRIIAEKRMIPASEAKSVKRLRPSEVTAIMAHFA